LLSAWSTFAVYVSDGRQVVIFAGRFSGHAAASRLRWAASKNKLRPQIRHTSPRICAGDGGWMVGGHRIQTAMDFFAHFVFMHITSACSLIIYCFFLFSRATGEIRLLW